MMSNRVHYDVVVSGVGISGLMSAFCIIDTNKSKPKSILLLSDRAPGFLRPHRVVLNPEVKKILSNISISLSAEDKKFISILNNEYTIDIKQIERYLKRQLDELSKIGMKIDYEFYAELSSVDMQTGVASYITVDPTNIQHVIQQKELSFTYLIGADGKNHHALNIIKKDNQSADGIEYHSVKGLEHLYHASAHLQVSQVEGRKLPKPEGLVTGRTNEVSLGDQCDGENEESLFYSIAANINSYEKNNQRKIKCTFVGEVPTDIYIINNLKERKKTMRDYIATIIQQQIGDEVKVKFASNSKKYGEHKNKLKLMFFSSHLLRANKAAFAVSGRYFLMVGDSIKNPNYQQGGGVSIAILQSHFLGLVVNGKATIKNYNEFCKKLIRDHVAEDEDTEKLVERRYQPN